MTPLSTGMYFITNRRHKNIAILPDDNDHSGIVAGIQENGPGEMWNVNRLSNGTYEIQNDVYLSFANIETSTKASRGDGIVGGSRPQQWSIVETKSKGDYCICPTSNTDICWSLPDGETDSPIILGTRSNAPQNQWNFTKVEDDRVMGIQSSTTTFHTQPAYGPMPSSSKPDFAPEAPGRTTLTSHLANTSKMLEDYEKTTAAKPEKPNTEERWVSVIGHSPSLNSVKEDKYRALVTKEKQRLAEEHDWSFAHRNHTKGFDPLFIHSAILPILNVTLNEALLVDLPSCSNPLDYINADADRINGIVQGLLALTQHGEFRHAIFTSGMIYRRLIVYIYTHLVLCTSEKRFVNGFEETLREWRTWDNVTVMQNYQLIRDHLYDLFHRGLKSNRTLHSEDDFFKLDALDAIGLRANLMVMITDNIIYKKMLDSRGQGAQALLNLLQARLEFPIDSQHKARHVKALLRLSRASGLCPECLVLKGIKMEAHPVDRGGYGDVYKGVWHGQEIAIKVLRIYQTSDLFRLLKEFSCEAVLWKQLSHPNVLPFYGIYHLDEATPVPRLCLTAPWMENGNVVEFLKRYPDTYCIHLALDIIQGLQYLHNFTPSIIHGDLKGVNVLVTRSGRACLADFGLATAIDSKTIAITHTSTAKSGGTMRWQAPELLNVGADETDNHDQRNSQASDIYAFACVCYEMFSGEIPFFENAYDIQVILGVIRGRRPTRPMLELCSTRGLSDELWDLIQTCWAQNPMERPAAEQIMERLRALPNWQDDRRPLDDFSISLPHQAVYNYPDHPFSALTTATTDGDA